MVYLVWFKSEGKLETLIGVWPSREEAEQHCDRVARSFAEGSGMINPSMMGDLWEVQNMKRERFRVRFDELPFGVVE